MVRFLNAKCEEVEDSIELDDTEFITDDQATCLNSSSELAVNMIMSNPINLYMVATGLFANLVCLRLRNMSKRIRLLAGTNNKYEYGSETNISYASFTNCRVREDNARARFGPKYEPDTTKRWHNSHRVIPPNFLWLDKLEKQIYEIACKTTGKKLKLPQSITERKNAITSIQAGNFEKAFEFRKENLELRPSDEMLSNASGKGYSIREYAARIAALPMRINERNKDMARSEHHSLVMKEMLKNRVADFMTYIGELIISPLIAKALEHYKKSDTTTNPGISSVRASKESRMMMRMYAQFCLENKNAAFLIGINKKTFYCIVYTLNRFRFSASNYKQVNIHQYIFLIKSAVVCRGYYSPFGDKSKDEQVAFNVKEEVEGEDIEKDKKRELNLFLSLSAKNLLLEEDYEIEEMKEERMKRKREDEEGEIKEAPVKYQRTSTNTIATKVAASPDSRRVCNDEFDFSA
ncbi:hypothetical protein O3P69_018876 [Scylla paramamosain]|uniref:Uncharacterized protein n=1 Tax=Scylla paramamosain TaxID=85552 RepID=A0AAW0SU31_SCYPA